MIGDRSMKVAWIFRSKKRKEHSIENVFESIYEYLSQYGIEKHYLPEARWNTLAAWRKNISYIKRIDAEIHHITGEVYYVANFIRSKTLIITLEDLVLINRNKGLKRLYYYIFYYGLAFLRADQVVCISKTVRSEMTRKYPFSKGKALYIPCPVNEIFQYSRKDFNETEPVILVVGTQYNKNIERIIKALDEVNCVLMVVGLLSDEHVNLLKTYHIKYENKYNIPIEELYELYKKCDILCFPSLFEGFGMPIIEGQAVGRAVLTSDYDPMLEVSGGEDCACLVNPKSVDDIRDGILKIVRDKKYRENLIDNGLKNAKKYRSRRVAELYGKLYERYLEKV